MQGDLRYATGSWSNPPSVFKVLFGVLGNPESISLFGCRALFDMLEDLASAIGPFGTVLKHFSESEFQSNRSIHPDMSCCDGATESCDALSNPEACILKDLDRSILTSAESLIGVMCRVSTRDDCDPHHCDM